MCIVVNFGHIVTVKMYLFILINNILRQLYCRGQYSWSLDVWQVACCVLFMCTGCRPWRHAYFNCDVNHHNRNCFMHSITKKISAYLKHLLPGFLPPTLHTLLSQCLHSDWKNRLTPLDAMYMLDSDLKSRNKLLSSHDITGSPCGISAATPMAPVQNDNSQPIAVDIYLAEYTERMPELYLQPGWIASLNLPHNKTITYGDLKSLIYDSTELEVMKYLKNCDFYIYKNDRIKIRDLLIKELTLEQFSKMNDSDIVDPDNAVIMRYMDSFYP